MIEKIRKLWKQNPHKLDENQLETRSTELKKKHLAEQKKKNSNEKWLYFESPKRKVG